MSDNKKEVTYLSCTLWIYLTISDPELVPDSLDCKNSKGKNIIKSADLGSEEFANHPVVDFAR